MSTESAVVEEVGIVVDTEDDVDVICEDEDIASRVSGAVKAHVQALAPSTMAALNILLLLLLVLVALAMIVNFTQREKSCV